MPTAATTSAMPGDAMRSSFSPPHPISLYLVRFTALLLADVTLLLALNAKFVFHALDMG
jgi:hypothetical protein